MSSKPTPLAKGQMPFDQLLTIRTAHDVRKLAGCAHCEQIGHSDQMILGWPFASGNQYFHGRCFAAAYGADALRELAAEGRANKLTLGDLGIDLMHVVVDALSKAEAAS